MSHILFICSSVGGHLGYFQMEIPPFVTTWMHLEDVRPSEISWMQEGKYCMKSLTCGSKLVKLLETEGRVVVAGVWGRVEWALVEGYRVSAVQDEWVVESWCTARWLRRQYCRVCLTFAKRVVLGCSHLSYKKKERGGEGGKKEGREENTIYP